MSLAQTQGTQFDRIDSRGQVKTDVFLNRAAISMVGATPSVASGNVFLTNNPGVVTVTNFLGGADTQLITINCGDANTTIQNNSNIVNAAGTDFICGINKTISYNFFSALGKWVQSGTGAGGGGGGGGSPGTPDKSVQCNNAGNFGACNATDSGTTFSVNENLRVKGPNPYIDVTAPPYNVRAVTTVPSTTCSISAGSTAATLAAASTFQNGDGFVCYGAGATNTMSTSGAPTVTPSLAAGSMRTEERVPSLAGATSYAYTIVARNKNGALTATSANGTTSTGLATLGVVQVNITSLARANNVVTVTMSGATDIVAGAGIYINGTSNANTFDGAYLVASRIDSTHFTYVQGYDTREGATTSATGGTVSWYAHNHLSWTAVTGAFEYEIYGRIAGSLVFIGTSKPLELSFDDYGTTVMGTPLRPSYVPSTPPVSAINEPLVTTIVSGAGTTSLVLANAAVNTVSGATALFDNSVNFLAAKASSGSIPLYFPSAAAGTYVFNAYTNANSGGEVAIWQAGGITLNETLELPDGTVWRGDMGGGGSLQTGFQWSTTRLVAINAFPGIWFSGPSGGNLSRGVGFRGNLGLDQELLILIDGAAGFGENSFDYCAFSTGSASNYDVLGIGVEVRGSANTMITKSNFLSSLNNGGSVPIGLYAPSLLVRGGFGNPNGGGPVFLRDTFWMPKGIGIDLTFAISNNQGTIDGAYSQGSRTPLVTVEQSFVGALGSAWKISNVTLDTTFAPIYANLSSSTNSLILDNIGAGGIGTSGTPISGLVGPGGANTGIINGANFSNNPVTVNGNGNVQYGFSGAIAAPAVAVSAGGIVPNGAQPYSVQFIDINGNFSPRSSIATATTTTGNNTVTITEPTIPPGMVSWTAYRNTSQILCSVTPVSTTTIVDNFVPCGQQVRVPTAGVSMISAAGLSSPTFTLINGGFTSTITQASLTANRANSFPDAAGVICVTGFCAPTTITIGGDATLSSSPRAVPPVFFPGALTTTWTGASWTLDKAITVTRVQSAVKVVPAGCSTSAIVRVTDGSTPINLTINAATNDSGAITQNYAAGATLSVSIQTAAAGCTTSPGDLNLSLTSRMQ